MEKLVRSIQTFLSSKAVLSSPASPANKQAPCPMRSLCLGCDGQINCSLARLAVAETPKAG